MAFLDYIQIKSFWQFPYHIESFRALFLKTDEDLKTGFDSKNAPN